MSIRPIISTMGLFKFIKRFNYRTTLWKEVQHKSAVAVYQYQHRNYSSTSPQRPPGFFSKIVDNIKDEVSRNQKMKESIKEFRKDMQQLEKSDALQKAREKYKNVEEETAEGTKKARQQIHSIKKKMSESIDEAQRTEILQKASKITEEASKQAHKVGQTITEKGEQISKTQTFQTISKTAKAVKEEIDQSTFGFAGSRVYQAPQVLRKRVERDDNAEERIIQANTQATGVVLHHDSRFAQSWQNFRDNNPYVGKVLEFKTKLDESDNPVVRASLLIRDKATELFGGVFERTELSEALTEICKMDPKFDKELFLLQCEYDIIPNVLEAIVRPDLEVLRDWCYERAFSMMSEPIRRNQHLGLFHENQILDIDNVDLLMGKVLDEGPILAISFQSQEISCIKNRKGETIEGDPSSVMRVQHVWILCRNQAELDPRAAWRILESTSEKTQQFV